MSNPNILTPINKSEVHTSDEVYEHFYQEFGEPSDSDLILPPRIVHINQEGDGYNRDLHLVVHANPNRRTLWSGAGTDEFGISVQKMHYDNRDYAVVTCDGTKITEWETVGAQGLHDGRLNGIDQKYDPKKLFVELVLTDPDAKDKMLKLRFNLVDKSGVMELGDGELGWVVPPDTNYDFQPLTLQERLAKEHLRIGTTALAA